MKKPVGSFGEKLVEAGFKSDEALLAEKIAELKEQFGVNHSGAKQAFVTAVLSDIALLRAVMKPVMFEYINKAWNSARPPANGGYAKGHISHAEKASVGMPSRFSTPAAPPNQRRVPLAVVAAVNSLDSRALLDSFFINGKKLGDCTPFECRNWMQKTAHHLAFVDALISGIPENTEIRRFRNNEDAHAYFVQTRKGA